MHAAETQGPRGDCYALRNMKMSRATRITECVALPSTHKADAKTGQWSVVARISSTLTWCLTVGDTVQLAEPLEGAERRHSSVTPRNQPAVSDRSANSCVYQCTVLMDGGQWF